MLIDFLLSLLANSAAAGAQSRRVPKPLRIALAALFSLFLLMLGGFMLLCAVGINGGIAVRLVCEGLGALCLGYLAFFLRGVRRAMR